MLSNYGENKLQTPNAI